MSAVHGWVQLSNTKGGKNTPFMSSLSITMLIGKQLKVSTSRQTGIFLSPNLKRTTLCCQGCLQLSCTPALLGVFSGNGCVQRAAHTKRVLFIQCLQLCAVLSSFGFLVTRQNNKFSRKHAGEFVRKLLKKSFML